MLIESIICMGLNVFHEAKGEPLDGMMAVAQVTMNRVNKSGDSVCEVVFNPKQFSWANRLTTVKSEIRVSRAKSLVPPKDRFWKASLEVAKLALSGNMRDVVGNAMYFHSASIETPEFFKTRKFLKQIGNQKFYL